MSGFEKQDFYKYPDAPTDWRWQWVFPQKNRWKNIKTGEEGRHHTHETILQRAVKEAVRNAGVVKHVGCHTFRHYAQFQIMRSSGQKTRGSLAT